MQSNPYRDMKFILLYRDHFIKVGYNILDIFTSFGAPNTFVPRSVPGRSANRSIYFVIRRPLQATTLDILYKYIYYILHIYK